MIQRGVGWGIRYIFIYEQPFQLSFSNAIYYRSCVKTNEGAARKFEMATTKTTVKQP